jgi:DNA modification methylase
MAWKVMQGDVREKLAELPEKSVQCVVTSPPYWGLRDYGLPPSVWGGDPECEHELVLKKHKPEEYVQNMVAYGRSIPGCVAGAKGRWDGLVKFGQFNDK